MKTIIHVNRHHLAMNAKDGRDRPVYSVKQGRSIRYSHSVEITGGTVRLVDPRHHSPLKCGAKAWIEVEGGVITVDGSISFQEVEAQASQPSAYDSA